MPPVPCAANVFAAPLSLSKVLPQQGSKAVVTKIDPTMRLDSEQLSRLLVNWLQPVHLINGMTSLKDEHLLEPGLKLMQVQKGTMRMLRC